MSEGASEPGIQFGRYRLSQRLATGGMGEIFLAEMDAAAGIKKKVVIKRILPHLAKDEKFVQRFLDEGRLVAQLSHGNLVPIFDIGIHQGQYFLAMEHVDGIDLDALIRHQNRLGKTIPVAAAIHILSMGARALDYVHTRVDDEGRNLHIVHRDISPQNIMIALSGEVKILDFGIAKARTRHLQSIPGFIAGKIPYMSPEQLAGQKATVLSDLYSLGAVVYQLLTGEFPYQGESESDLIKAVQNDAARPIQSLIPELHPDLCSIINACIAREPSERPTSAAHLRKELAEAVKETGLTSGEEALRKLANDFEPQGSKSNSFDDLLLQQVDGAWESMTDSVAGAMTHSTKSVHIELPHQTPAPVEKPSQGLSSPQERSPSRVGFKRWIFLATILGLSLGLFLMFTLQESPPTPTPTPIQPTPKKSTRFVPTPPIRRKLPVINKPKLDVKSSQITTPVVRSKEADIRTVKKDTTPIQIKATKSTRLTINPKEAKAYSGSKLLGSGTVWIRGKSNQVRKVEVRADGFQTQTLKISPGNPSAQSVNLKKVQSGSIAFRFYPANAQVFLDGKKIDTGGTNRIKKTVSSGKHVLLIKDFANQKEKRLEFDLGPNQNRILGTIDLSTR